MSHHTGANYQTDKLEAIIIRFAKEELQYLTDQPIEEIEEYFEARKISTEEKKENLKKLFVMAWDSLLITRVSKLLKQHLLSVSISPSSLFSAS